MTDTGLRPCAGGCGEMVRGTWKRGHKARFEARGTCAENVTLLPGPGADDDELDAYVDMGVVGPPPADPAGSASPWPDGPDGREIPPAGGSPEIPSSDDEEIPEDTPPRHGGPGIIPPDRRTRTTSHGHGSGKIRVTAAVRKDIEAKVTMMLIVPGKIWQARDPACGGVFVDTIPGQAPAWTDIICDSADLVEFFTGTGGAFMKYLNLMTVLMPVFQMVWAHHVAHTVELRPETVAEAPDLTAYAA
jgi:hypothetical protein